jgi:hypothetical protein
MWVYLWQGILLSVTDNTKLLRIRARGFIVEPTDVFSPSIGKCASTFGILKQALSAGHRTRPANIAFLNDGRNAFRANRWEVLIERYPGGGSRGWCSVMAEPRSAAPP